MLKWDNLSIAYENNASALRHFSLSVQEGEIVALVGESGSGKTTAIRSVMGILPIGGKVTEGHIYYKDKDITHLSEKEWLKIRGSHINMIFQNTGAMLNPLHTIGRQFIEYIRFHRMGSKKETYQFALQQLAKVGLPNPANVMASVPSELSGGMQQRVGIAMAMALNPQVLLADEPTGALDATIQKQIVMQIDALRKEYKTTIVLVTHNIAVATYLADRLVVMKDGVILEVNDKKNIINNPQHEYTKCLLSAVERV